MKLIEPTKKPVKTSQFQQLIDSVREMLPFGKTEQQAREAILAHFMRGLDNRFTILRDLPIEGPGIPFPLILIGPSGVAVLNVSNDKGIFRAKDESWWELNKTTRSYGPARRNLIKLSQAYAQRLATFLDTQGKAHPEVWPVLIFANPGVHVDTTRPAIRIVLMDGVDRLIANLLKSEEVLQPTDIKALSDTLERVAKPEMALPLGEGEDFFGKDLIQPVKKAPAKLPTVPIPEEMPLPGFLKRLNFTKKQLIILGVMAVGTVLCLLAFIVVAFMLNM